MNGDELGIVETKKKIDEIGIKYLIDIMNNKIGVFMKYFYDRLIRIK